MPKDSGLITNFETSDVVHAFFTMSGWSFKNLRTKKMLTPKGRLRGSAGWGPVTSGRGGLKVGVVVIMVVPAAIGTGTGVGAGRG